MKSTLYQTLSNGQSVEILDIGQDANYARDCFDGSDREWSELVEHETNPNFFIVSLGMPGYMSDSVAVFTSLADARNGAKFWIENDEETKEEESSEV